tara:strand:+ start:6423 stop:8057 length:1635 start_codon:yes stop_codon:yes gene_type:complete
MDNVDINGSVANETVNKWAPVLEGIESDYTRRVTAQLLENQAKAIISDKLREDVTADIGGMNTVGRLGTFQKFAFPLVRRVYPELIANNIVGVQPMQGPVSQIFYLGNSRRDSTTAAGGDGTQTIYSKYNLTYRGLIADPIATGGNIDLDRPADLNLDVSNVMSATSGGPEVTVGGEIANFPNPARTGQLGAGPASLMGFSVSAGERLAGSGIPEMLFQIEQQPVAARTRKMRALWTLEASQDLKAYHNLDLEQELTDLLGKELRLEIDREIIEDLRMLAYGVGKAGGSLADSIWQRDTLDQSMHGANGPSFDFKPDFTGASSFQYDGGANINQIAGGNEGTIAGTGNANGDPTYDNVFLLDFSSSALDFAPQHVGHVYANLMALCQRAATDIYKTTMRGPGNFMVTSPTVAAMLHAAAKMEGGIERADGPSNMTGARVEYKGKLGGQFDLYVDPMYPEDEILIGYKGANAMDGGYVYCPYIPLQQTPTITDPETFQPRKGIITRYGKAEVAPASRFYRIIRLVGPTANYLFTPFVQLKNNSYI